MHSDPNADTRTFRAPLYKKILLRFVGIVGMLVVLMYIIVASLVDHELLSAANFLRLSLAISFLLLTWAYFLDTFTCITVAGDKLSPAGLPTIEFV